MSSKKNNSIYFFLTIVSISIITYKVIFNKTEVGDAQELVEKETKPEEESIEELDLEDINIEK